MLLLSLTPKHHHATSPGAPLSRSFRRYNGNECSRKRGVELLGVWSCIASGSETSSKFGECRSLSVRNHRDFPANIRPFKKNMFRLWRAAVPCATNIPPLRPSMLTPLRPNMLDKKCASMGPEIFPVLGLWSGGRLLGHYQTSALYWMIVSLR